MQRTDFRTLLCLGALAVLPYINALSAGFTFDDEGMIVKNPIVQAPAWPLPALLTATYEPGAIYRPVTFFTYWVNQRLHPGWAAGFHAVNLILHAAVTALVYALSLRLLGGRAAALASAAVFAVHPIHTEAVTSIIGRAELLAALGVLAALLFAARAEDEPGRRRLHLVLGSVAFAGGLLAKESAFVFLPLLVIVRGAARGESLPAALARLSRGGQLPLFAAVGAAYLVGRAWIVGSPALPSPPEWLDNPLAHTGVAVRLATAATVLADYAGLLLLPLRLSADYSFDQISPVEYAGDPRLLAAGVLAAAIAVAAWRGRRTVPIAPWACLFVLAALAITSNVLFAIGTVKAERLLYLPSVGVCLIAGGAVAAAARRRAELAAAALASAVVLLGARAWMRNADWQDNLTLFRATTVVSPRSAKAHHNLGVALDAIGQHEEAALAFRRALEIYPDYAEAAFGVGRMYEARGGLDAALRWYTKALGINSRMAKARLNRGVIYYNHGELASAEADFRAGLEVEPENARLWTGLALCRLAQGDREEARRSIRRAAELDANDQQVRDAMQLAFNGRQPSAGEATP